MSDVAFERFESYRRGYFAGTRRGVRDPRYEVHDRDDLRAAYNAGYTDGEADNGARLNAARERYDFTPRILR